MAQAAININADVVRIAQRFRKVVEALGVPVERMILFGSYAKGSAHARSDIDLAVVSPDFGHDDVEEMQRLWKQTHLVDLRIEPFPLSSQEYNYGTSPIAQEIREHGIRV